MSIEQAKEQLSTAVNLHSLVERMPASSCHSQSFAVCFTCTKVEQSFLHHCNTRCSHTCCSGCAHLHTAQSILESFSPKAPYFHHLWLCFRKPKVSFRYKKGKFLEESQQAKPYFNFLFLPIYTVLSAKTVELSPFHSFSMVI